MFDWLIDFFKDMKYDSTAKRVGKIIVTGLFAAPAIYLLAFLLNFITCFFTCGLYGTFEACIDLNFWYDQGYGNTIRRGQNTCFPSVMWSGSAFGYTLLFLLIAGIVIGVIYAIAVATQDGREERKRGKTKRGQSINATSNTVGDVIKKYNNVASLIKNVKYIIFSTKAKKLLEEAALKADKIALELEKAVKIVENAKGKSSKTALKNVRQAENVIKLLDKDVDEANDLYIQAKKEVNYWDFLVQEADNAITNAKNAADNAGKEAVKIEKKVFVSAAAKDASEKVFYALAKAKEAVEETLKRAEAAAKATSANDAQQEVICAKNSAKRTLVEEKIVVEEVKIAIEAEG